MKIVLFCLLELSFVVVNLGRMMNSKGDRLGMFQTYHNQRRPSKYHPPKNETILAKICTAQICTKCVRALRYQDMGTGKIQKYCFRILKLRNCCPLKLLIRSGF